MHYFRRPIPSSSNVTIDPASLSIQPAEVMIENARREATSNISRESTLVNTTTVGNSIHPLFGGSTILASNPSSMFPTYTQSPISTSLFPNSGYNTPQPVSMFGNSLPPIAQDS